MSNKEIKERARKVMKGHYFMLFIICFFVSFIGVEQSVSMSGVKSLLSYDFETGGMLSRYKITGLADVVGYLRGEKELRLPKSGSEIREYLTHQVPGEMKENVSSFADGVKEYIDSIPTSADQVGELVNGTVNDIKESVQQNMNPTEENKLPSNYGPIELGTQEGVLAMLVNAWTSGTLLTIIFSGCISIGASENVAIAILIGVVLVFWVFIWFFILRVYTVISKRFFLESRVYRKVPPRRVFTLVRCGKWFNVAWVLFRTTLCEIAWSLTIVGGYIKHFSYMLVPYIMAENPNVRFSDAIKLSMRMMKGHKWKVFCLELSFIGWKLLGILTFGIFDIFFTNQYILAAESEYYTYLRRIAKENSLEGSEFLNDTYLYEQADSARLQIVYEDMIEEMMENEGIMPPEERKGFWGFLAKNFGIVLRSDKQEQLRCEYEEKRLRNVNTQAVLDKEIYPSRLAPFREKEHMQVRYLHYLRRYSIWTLILMFFTCAFGGWLWEVGLHLVEDGVFVNRGVLLGPWLPIYGTGGVLMIVLLYRFRKNILAELFLIVTVSGVVEYFTSLILEQQHGLKWWDYTGYFINVEGRVCAEGLLVFGVFGMFMVYFLAPVLDNLFKKIRLRVVIPICAGLVILFVADCIYSHFNPNTGAGITDYGTEEVSP